jgi:GT2 family glycosyltransferase
MGTAPRVSVIIPCYNAAAFVAEGLESVFGQTFRDYEVLVVNDGSPDTPELEEALLPYRDRIRYLNQENGGPGSARNTGIAHARGEYVAFLDSDDLWAPEFLTEQLSLIEKGFDLVYADAYLIGDSPIAGYTFMQKAPSRGAVGFESLLRRECVVYTSSVLARRQTLIDAGLFDPRFFHSEDFDLWLRVAHQGGRLGYQQKVLGSKRSHGGNLTAVSGALLRGQAEICEKLLRTLELASTERDLLTAHRDWCNAQLALEHGKRELLAGRHGEALRALANANAVLNSSTIRLSLIGLRVAPGLLRRAYARRLRQYASQQH